MLEYINNMTDKKILSQHPYAITQNKDGRFSTYLPDESKPGKRRKLVKADRKILEREIIKFYKEREQKEALANISLRNFYPKWHEYKSLHSNSSAYMRNIDGLWLKYYEKDPLIDRPLAELDEYSLDVWAHGNQGAGAHGGRHMADLYPPLLPQGRDSPARNACHTQNLYFHAD